MNDLKYRTKQIAVAVRRHIIILFVLFLLTIYGVLAFKAISLEKVGPDQSAVTSNLKTAGVPHVDQDVVSKIQQLQDNSVDVQTLFDQARDSPFQE